jgi:acetylornithine deacetylase/succinyl-diaminopimelate desuccinylase-like protein
LLLDEYSPLFNFLFYFQGGVQANVVPSELSIVVDFRVSPNMGLSEFKKRLDGWIAHAGPGITVKPVCAFDSSAVTSIKDDNKFWAAFAATCQSL